MSQEYIQVIKGESVNEEKMKYTFRKQLLLVGGLKQDKVDIG